MDNIWLLRNMIVHDMSLLPQTLKVLFQYIKDYKKHCNAWDNKQLNESHNWRATPRDRYILLFDIVVRNTGNTTTAICKLDDGSPIFVITKFNQSQNPNSREVTAIYIGITKAKVKQVNKLIIARGSLFVLQAVNNPDKNSDWIIQSLINGIRSKLQYFEN